VVWKTIVKGAIKGAFSTFITIIIPLWIIGSIGRIFEEAIQQSFEVQQITIGGYELEKYFVLIIFISLIIGVLEESKDWRILGRSLHIALFVFSFLLIYMILQGGMFSREIVVGKQIIVISIDLRLPLYAYGFLIVFPSVTSSLIDMLSSISSTSE